MIYLGTIEFQVLPNRLLAKECDIGRTVDVEADHAFSSEHALIADVECFERAVGEVVRQLVGNRRFFSYPKAMIASTSQPISNVERQALQKGLLNAGFSKVGFSSPPIPPRRT